MIRIHWSYFWTMSRSRKSTSVQFYATNANEPKINWSRETKRRGADFIYPVRLSARGDRAYFFFRARTIQFVPCESRERASGNDIWKKYKSFRNEETRRADRLRTWRLITVTYNSGRKISDKFTRLFSPLYIKSRLYISAICMSQFLSLCQHMRTTYIFYRDWFLEIIYIIFCDTMWI